LNRHGPNALARANLCRAPAAQHSLAGILTRRHFNMYNPGTAEKRKEL
jgi:hypothetical protein